MSRRELLSDIVRVVVVDTIQEFVLESLLQSLTLHCQSSPFSAYSSGQVFLIVCFVETAGKSDLPVFFNSDLVYDLQKGK